MRVRAPARVCNAEPLGGIETHAELGRRSGGKNFQ